MAREPTALSALQTLVVLPDGYPLPVGELRAGRTRALAALRGMAFLAPTGPKREEVLVMGALLRAEGASDEAAVALIGQAASRECTAAAWREGLAGVLADGAGRPAIVTRLLALETLQAVGFPAADARALGHGLAELKAAGYSAAGFLSAGWTSATQLADELVAAMQAKESDEVLLWYAVKEVAAQGVGKSWMVRRVADAGASAAVVDAMLAASGATSIARPRPTREHARARRPRHAGETRVTRRRALRGRGCGRPLFTIARAWPPCQSRIR